MDLSALSGLIGGSGYSLPKLQYIDKGEDAPPPSYKESVEIAARQVFGMPDKNATPYTGYGVNTSKIGDKQVAPPYVQQQADTAAGNRASALQKKWSVTGTKPTTVGSGTAAKRRVV